VHNIYIFYCRLSSSLEIFGGQKENLINMLFPVQRGDSGLQGNQPQSSIQTIIVSLSGYKFRPRSERGVF